MRRLISTALTCALTVAAAHAAQTSTQSPPVPRPFPGSATPPAPAPGGTSAGTPATTATQLPPAQIPAPEPPPAGTVDAYLFPNAEFLGSHDAGRGHQRFLLYGTNTSYAEVIAYYRGSLRGSGNREVFRTPPVHQFDLARFDDATMAYPPSVVVKDYTWNGSPGYLHVSGTTQKRFRTVVQIVLPGPAK